MGFKDVEVFNIALLGKQVWRMLTEPGAYWVKVLKGIYFHISSLMEARKGGRASWAWNSLIEGRDFRKDKPHGLIFIYPRAKPTIIQQLPLYSLQYALIFSIHHAINKKEMEFTERLNQKAPEIPTMRY